MQTVSCYLGEISLKVVISEDKVAQIISLVMRTGVSINALSGCCITNFHSFMKYKKVKYVTP